MEKAILNLLGNNIKQEIEEKMGRWSFLIHSVPSLLSSLLFTEFYWRLLLSSLNQLISTQEVY